MLSCAPLGFAMLFVRHSNDNISQQNPSVIVEGKFMSTLNWKAPLRTVSGRNVRIFPERIANMFSIPGTVLPSEGAYQVNS